MTAAVAAALVAGTVAAQTPAQKATGPVVVFETVKGTFEIELFPNEAPKSTEHILALVKRNFYNGLRVHRFVAGFVVQFGDPQTRDMTKKHLWGNGGSGRDIGVSEVSPKRPHRVGAVALAYAKDPRTADSQLYIALSGLEDPRMANLQSMGTFAVIGQVISGMDVVRMLREPDIIRRATVRQPGRGGK
jgi:peptidyl-prolyl cis-trans isomerase B (cyclophilin B)